MMSVESILHEQHDLSNFPQLCRLCGNLKESVPIYDEMKQSNYHEVINLHISNIQISQTDVLPLKLCIDCLTYVISWHEFHQTCLQIDEKLRAVVIKFGITKQSSVQIDQSAGKVTNDIEVIEVNVESGDYDFYNDGVDDYKEPILIEESTEVIDDCAETENQPKIVADRSPKKNIQIVAAAETYTKYESDTCNKAEGGNDEANISTTYSDDDKSRADEFLVDVSELSGARRSSCELDTYGELDEDKSLLKGFVLKDDTSRYHCASCFVAYVTKDELLKHIRSEHAPGICRRVLYECGACPRVFTLNEHRNLHRAEKHAAKEPLAGDLKVVRTDDTTQIENVEVDDTYVCRYCDKKFTVMGKLRLHKMRKHNVMYRNARRCSICSLVMLDKRALLLHLKMVHATVPTENSDKIGVNEEYLEFLSKRIVYVDQTRYFQCEECPYRCRTVQQFLRHGRRHVVTNPTCAHCGKSFNAKSLLRRHILLVHMGIKRFPCPECGKMFGERRHMEEHRNLHREVCSYICEICGKQFKQVQSMTVHMQIHRGKKSYHCEYCDKAFTFRSKLLNHMKHHTGKNLSVCTVCNKTFTSSSYLKTHMFMHSDMRAFHCRMCKKAYKTNRTLKQHLIAVHDINKTNKAKG